MRAPFMSSLIPYVDSISYHIIENIIFTNTISQEKFPFRLKRNRARVDDSFNVDCT